MHQADVYSKKKKMSEHPPSSARENTENAIARREKPRRKPRRKDGNELSKIVRQNMALSRPPPKKVRGSVKVPEPSQKLIRTVMSSGHMGAMGQKRLMKPFKVVRHIRSNGWLTGVSNAENGSSYELQLDQVPGFADFTALFDQYRFTKVTWALLPRHNIHSLTTTATATTANLGNLIVASDPDDSVAPTTTAELNEYEGARWYAGYELARGVYKPRAAIAAYGGAFTQFADFDGWIDCASDDASWYALKAACTAAGAAQTTFQVWDLVLAVKCQFRFVH